MQAAGPKAVRLPLSLSALGTGAEVSYHPNRWLTVRRAIAALRSNAFTAVPPAAGSAREAKLSAALTGDIYPFGGSFRFSLGLRGDPNHRLLRGANDGADMPAAAYAPTLTVGFEERLSGGLAFSADVGLSGRTIYRQRGNMLLTPLDTAAARSAPDRGPLVRVSADYRF